MQVNVACTQMHCSWELEANVARAEALVHQAADEGAQIILLQELFETPYFCIDEQNKHFDLAHPIDEQPTIQRMQKIARERELVLPVSFFERAGPAHYNAVAIVDADGSNKTPLPGDQSQAMLWGTMFRAKQKRDVFFEWRGVFFLDLPFNG